MYTYGMYNCTHVYTVDKKCIQGVNDRYKESIWKVRKGIKDEYGRCKRKYTEGKKMYNGCI